MSRKRKQFNRDHKPDHKYNSVTVTRFINKLMQKGKKSVAERICYGAIEKLAKEVQEQPLAAFEASIKNVTPKMEVKSRRVGGATYQVPVEVRQSRALSLAMRWIVGNSRGKSGKSMVDILSQELIDAYNNTGASVKKKEDTHKMADANKAFSHFRW